MASGVYAVDPIDSPSTTLPRDESATSNVTVLRAAIQSASLT